MLTRRVLALYTSLCLLLSLAAIPQGPVLVCRMTGEPMTPVAASSEEATGSCCDVAALPDGGGTRHVLTDPGCCDLIQGVERADEPAVTAASPLEVVDAALLPTPPAFLLASLTERAPAAVVLRDSAPRGPPPLSPSSPRAPPFFS